MKNFTRDQIKQAIATTKSMKQAAIYLKCSYSTFRKIAITYGVFVSNQQGKGTSKPSKYKSEEDIFINGKFIHSQCLRKWFFKKQEYKCSICGISEWFSKLITIELDHINGNRLDNRLENLRPLCPNCHSQTENFKSKNKHKYINGSPTKGIKTFL